MILRKTRSVCPVCLRNLPAALCRREDGRIFMEKTCPEHGSFQTLIWQGAVDFDRWLLGTEPLPPTAGANCPANCGICPEHDSGTCCALLEVTYRCNLRCRYCFADGGRNTADPSLEDLKAAVREIVSQCGQPLLQLSGGEPTLREDLPDLVRYAKEAGCSCVQVNTNGIRLAEDPSYAAALAEAGLDIVFLQFDGTRDEIYKVLRGRPLLQTKLRAVRVCSDLRLGVTLVPTVVKGVNHRNLGELISLAALPGARGPGRTLSAGILFRPLSGISRGRKPLYPGSAYGGHQQPDGNSHRKLHALPLRSSPLRLSRQFPGKSRGRPEAPDLHHLLLPQPEHCQGQPGIYRPPLAPVSGGDASLRHLFRGNGF